MSVLDSAPGLLEALRGEMTPKFLATRSPDGAPNVVPVISILPADDQPDVLFFGNFLLCKSIQNLQEDVRVGVLVMTPELQGWILKGDFLEFQRTGPYVDRQMNSSLLRYNAYTGIRNAGLIRVRSLETTFRIPRLRVATDYLVAKITALGTGGGGNGIQVPAPVRQEFAKMVAVKVLAWIGEDGYPTAAPALSLQPAGTSALLCRQPLGGPPNDVAVAANILTFDAVSYQVKGQWRTDGKTGFLSAQEVYAGGPPIPGGRVA